MTVKSGVEDRKVLTEFLKAGVKKGKAGYAFYKAKKIAKELEMSPKEVGSNLKILSETVPEHVGDLRITPWSYSKSTTWKVELVTDDNPAM